MDTSSDAIRFAHDEDYVGGNSTNWYVLLFAVIITLFAVYWGFVRPTSRQLTKLRRYVTSLESSIADLNVQRASNGQAVSMLELMVEQEKTTRNAATALREMRDLHRQLVQEADQLASARQALESLASLRMQVARQSSLIASTDRALGRLAELRTQVTDSARETNGAKLALEKLNTVRDGLIESINRMDEADPLLTRVEELHMRLSSSTDQLDGLFALHDKIEAQTANVEKADATLDQLTTLQDRVIGQTDTVATAIETLELASDVELEMKRAGQTFSGVKHLLTEMSMMKPALQQAMDSLQPISELADLRRLGVQELRRVANVISTRHSAIAHSIVEPTLDPFSLESIAQGQEGLQEDYADYENAEYDFPANSDEATEVAEVPGLNDSAEAASTEAADPAEASLSEATTDDVEVAANAGNTTIK